MDRNSCFPFLPLFFFLKINKQTNLCSAFENSFAGQVIMDKTPGITCVVNKTNIIDSTYRNFKMEVLAGEENMVAKVRAN